MKNLKCFKYRKCYLPTHYIYYSKTYGYISKDVENNWYYKSKNINNILEDLSHTCLIYYFYANVLKYEKDNITKSDEYIHEHSFEYVVNYLYDYPESFSISEKDQIYYSKQELEYLNKIQKYLLFIGLRDLDITNRLLYLYRKLSQIDNIKTLKYLYYQRLYNIERKKIRIKRCSNTNVKKYYQIAQHKIEDDYLINLFMNNKEGYFLSQKDSFDLKSNLLLILDKNDNYKMLIEIKRKKLIADIDLDNILTDYKERKYKTKKEYRDDVVHKFGKNVKYITFKVVEIF